MFQYIIFPFTYFSLLSFSLYKCVFFCVKAKRLESRKWKWYFLMCLSLFTIVSTWYYIGRFIIDDYEKRGVNVGNYFEQSDLFDGAYRAVSDSVPKWWWSRRHLITAVSWAFLIWIEALEGSIWFILLGFFGAVGGAFPLWIIYYICERRKREKQSKWIAGSRNLGFQDKLTFVYSLGLALAALISIAITPQTLDEPGLFSLNLKMLHVHLMLIFVSNAPKSKAYHHLYWGILSIGSVAAFLWGYEEIFAVDLRSLFTVWNPNNPCQISINIDAVSSVVSLLFFINARGGNDNIVIRVFFSLFTLVAWPIAFPTYLYTLRP